MIVSKVCLSSSCRRRESNTSLMSPFAVSGAKPCYSMKFSNSSRSTGFT
jgi:hypothetical protein